MKRRIMIAATGLSAGTLIATTVINPKLVSNFMRIELVKADENGSNEDISEWMPDTELQKIIGQKLKIDVNNITKAEILKEMGKLHDARIDIKGVNDIKGIQHVKDVRILAFYDPIENIKNIELIDELRIKDRIIIEDMGIYDFDAICDIFSKMKNKGDNFPEVLTQIIKLNSVTVEGDKLVVDLNKYFGGDSLEDIAFDNAKVNGRTIERDEFYNSKSPLTFTFDINELKINSKFDYNKFDDTLEINFYKELILNGRKISAPIRFAQHFVIPTDDPKITAKKVNLKVGDNWEDRYGLETAIDGKGDNIPIENLYVDIGDLDTSTPGTYEVVYYYEKGSDVYAISKVTVTNRSGSGTGSGNSSVKGIDTTNIMTDQPALDIYNLSGNKKGTKKLTEEITDFETNKVNTVNGVEYYNLGNDEWVRADDVKVFHFNDSYVQTHGSKYKNLTKFRNTGTVEDRGLEKSTDWYTDRYAFFQGEWHHRVATHEWIHDDHVVEYQNINGVVHANETATLYNSKGKKITDRALAKDSAFLTDKKATINGKLMYRVATDEWVDADTVTFK